MNTNLRIFVGKSRDKLLNNFFTRLYLTIHQTDLSSKVLGLHFGSSHTLGDEAINHLRCCFSCSFTIFSKSKTALEPFLLSNGITISHHLLGQAEVGLPLGVILVPRPELLGGLLVSIQLEHFKNIIKLRLILVVTILTLAFHNLCTILSSTASFIHSSSSMVESLITNFRANEYL